MLKIVVDENSVNKRLDSFLAEINPDFSRSKVQNFIKMGNVKVNSESRKASYLIRCPF